MVAVEVDNLHRDDAVLKSTEKEQYIINEPG